MWRGDADMRKNFGIFQMFGRNAEPIGRAPELLDRSLRTSEKTYEIFLVIIVHYSNVNELREQQRRHLRNAYSIYALRACTRRARLRFVDNL